MRQFNKDKFNCKSSKFKFNSNYESYFGDVERNESGEHPARDAGQQPADQKEFVARGWLATAHRDRSGNRKNLKVNIIKI